MRKILSLVTALVIGGSSLYTIVPAKADENEGLISQQNPNLVIHDGDALVSKVDSTSSSENLSLNELSSKYDLKNVDINNLPEGSNVIEFKNEEDANKFLATEAAAPQEIEATFDDQGTTNSVGMNKLKALTASPYSTVRKSVSKNTGFASVNLKADIRVYSSGSFREIKDCNEWTDHTGVTFSLDWNEKYHHHYISSDHTRVEVTGGGVLDYVIFVSGIGKLFSRPIDLKFTYKL